MTDVHTWSTDATATALSRAVREDFQLIREIGRGGMGVVYLARDVQLQRDVAIKTLPPHLAADAHVRGRFLREARTAAALSHPNIVPIYSAAEREGVVYFSMAYVDGESLAERIHTRGPLTPDETVALLDQLAGALSAAHTRGVVHRDVKAENVLLDRSSGRAMVTDFGIARVAETPPHTATGTVLGTVQYMSPEQVSADPLDGRSDLYSLGVLAFFALTGRFPFERASASAVLLAHVMSAAPRVSSLLPHCPPVLDALIARLLAKAPADRYPDAAALQHALQSADFHRHRVGEIRHVGVPGSSHSEPVILTSREAQEVWSRAADLQANTGAQLPPPVFSPRGNEPAVTTGYDAALVKASAIEAGIDEKYVVRALDERDAGAAIAIQRDDSPSARRSALWGSPTKLEFTAAFDGELDGDGFEEIADEVRHVLGNMVTVSAVGRTLMITTGAPPSSEGASARLVHVHVSSRNGRTQVTVGENLTPLVGNLFAGLGLGAGMGVGAMVAGIVGGVTHSPLLIFLSGGICLSIAAYSARVLFARAFAKREAQLRTLVQRIVERSRHLKGLP